MYVHCILYLSCNVKKSPKQLLTCFKRAEANVVLIVFDGVICELCPYTLTVAKHESGTRKYLS